MILESRTSASFESFGLHFQEKIIQALLDDTKWAQQMYEVLNINFFDRKYLSFIAYHYFKHYNDYKSFPTKRLLFTSIIEKELKESNDEIIRSQIVNFLGKMKNNDVKDIDYVKDKSLEFCKKQSLRIALEKSVDMLEESHYEGIVQVVQEALYLGGDNSYGLELFDDITRFDETSRFPVPTGLKQLDEPEILNGGVSAGELAMVFASSGIGKSHFLVQMGANALRENKSVLHYTLEMSESKTALRYDSNLCGIPSNEITKRKSEVIHHYEQEKNLGKLIVKEFPTNIATIQSLRNHIDRLRIKNFVPDLIIIDYADLLRSSRNLDALRLELDTLYKDIRGLAQDLNIPIWTASQANRSSSSANVIALDGLAESYNKGMIVDFAVSLSRRPEEKFSGTGRLFIAKNRNGVDGKVFYINMDTSCSRINILEEVDPSNISNMNENPNAKEGLKNAWEKFKQKNEYNLDKN